MEHGLSAATQLISRLTKRRTNQPKRHYLKFRFSSDQSQDLGLSHVLRDPEVFSLHPNPEVGAAIMVSNSFHPHIQSQLLNYSKASTELNLTSTLADTLESCRCKESVRPGFPDNLLVNGHINSNDKTWIVSPLMRTLSQQGKKIVPSCKQGTNAFKC